jgi:branched-chain amino acid transport system permease protein
MSIDISDGGATVSGADFGAASDAGHHAALVERWRRRKTLARPLLVAIGLLALGLYVADSPYWLRVATSAGIAYILASSYNLVFGYAGLMTLAHTALYGIGGYASVIVADQWGWNFWIGVLVAIAAGCVGAIIVALPTARLGGIFLALGTLAFGIAAEEVFRQWTDITGGAQGFLGIQPPWFFGVELVGGTLPYFWLTAVAVLLTYEVLARTTSSRLGRRLVALRDSPLDTESIGVNPTTVRLTAFAISGALAGLAGALFAHLALFISPESFGLGRMIEVLIVVLIGGAGSRVGPVVGVAALVAIDEGGHYLGEIHPLMFGVVIVVIISFAPGGLAGIGRSIFNFVQQKRGRAAPVLAAPALAPGLLRHDDGLDAEEQLVVDDISVSFAGIHALIDVSLEVKRGEVLGLIGPNGAGKTTLINVISARVSPLSGRVLMGGVALNGRQPYHLPRLGVARTFQSTRMILSFDLLSNVMLAFDRAAKASLFGQIVHSPRSVRDDREAREQAIQLLGLVGVAEHALRRAGDVPYGVLRRAEIAKNLALRPRFLLLDEPGAGLSAFEREEVSATIRHVAEAGVGCILIDHNVSFVAGVCERIVVLSAGEVLTSGHRDDVLTDDAVIDAYLGTKVGR